MAIRLPRMLLLAVTLLGLAADARAVGQFVVGAAAVDITPPLAASAGPNPADCDLTGTFDGPHLFSLEEPYKDLNGNGRYDASDPTDPNVPPEPLVDCPTPTANGRLPRAACARPTAAGTASISTAGAASTASRPKSSIRSGPARSSSATGFAPSRSRSSTRRASSRRSGT